MQSKSEFTSQKKKKKKKKRERERQEFPGRLMGKDSVQSLLWL